MKKTFTLMICALAVFSQGFAQTDCSGGRYRTYNQFANTDVTSAVVFGSNVANGAPVDLAMDVYEPAGDTETNRPVVLIAFGGSFIGGARADVEFLCQIFAKMGYVAVAPDYRVGFFLPNEITTTAAVFRSAHDIKGCVRYLKKTVAEDGNPYGIDPEKIIIGGVSAGGIGAIHAAYLDDVNEIPSYMENDTAGLGGVEGNSGSLGYSSAPLAVLSFSGAIGDSAWINSGDMPLCSIHEENDGTVPYGTEEVSVSGFATGLIASGSRDMHVRAENVGVGNCLLTYRNVANHVGYLNPIDQEALDFATNFCANMVCDGASNCNSVDAQSVGIDEVDGEVLNLYPNPTESILNIDTDTKGQLEVIDITGRVVFTTNTIAGKNTIDVSSLTAGSYILKHVGENTKAMHFIKK